MLPSCARISSYYCHFESVSKDSTPYPGERTSKDDTQTYEYVILPEMLQSLVPFTLFFDLIPYSHPTLMPFSSFVVPDDLFSKSIHP